MNFRLPAPEGVDMEQLRVYGVAGEIWKGPVAFSVPVLLCHRHRRRDQPVYVITDIRSTDIREWKVRVVGVRTTTLGQLMAARPQFLLDLLTPARLPDGRTVWYRWHRCNPRNVMTHTAVAPPRVMLRRMEDVDAAARAARKELPVPVPAADALTPAMPTQFIPFDDLLALPARRAEAERAAAEMALMPPPAARAGEAGEAGAAAAAVEVFELAEKAPESDKELAVPVDADRNLDALEHDFDALATRWDEVAVRRFFFLFKRLLLKHAKCKLPGIQRVIAQTTVAGGHDLVCCWFYNAPRAIWVAKDPMCAALNVLVQVKSQFEKAGKGQQIKFAIGVAQEYGTLCRNFASGTNRPPSPNQWTTEEDERATGVKADAHERGVDALRGELRRAVVELREQAEQDVLRRYDVIPRTFKAETFDAEAEERFRALRKSNPAYRELQRQLAMQNVGEVDDDDDDA